MSNISPSKGWIKNNSTQEKKAFMYNPSSFEYSREATYSEVASPGISYPQAQYVGGKSRTFSLDLYMMDKPYNGLIDEFEEFLNKFLPPEMNNISFTPATLTFCLGNFIRVCVLESLTKSIEELDKNGQVTVATFKIQLRQVSI